VLVTQLGSWGGGSLVLPLLLVGVGLTVIWRQLDTDRTLPAPASAGCSPAGCCSASPASCCCWSPRPAGRRPQTASPRPCHPGPASALATAPLWRRLLASREAERTARVRSEERAAVAAHLHDSVLQTLAPHPAARRRRHGGLPAGPQPGARAAHLAVRAGGGVGGGTWAALVSGVVAEVEADHALTVESVVVGDAPLDDALTALGAATREALVNAAKHSGATAADLYTEVSPAAGRRLRPRPRRRVRPGRRAGRPARAARLGHRPADPAGRDGCGALGTGEGTEVELCLPRQEAAA
jgi:hypothetical protein